MPYNDGVPVLQLDTFSRGREKVFSEVPGWGVRGDTVNKGGYSGPVCMVVYFVFSLRGHCQSSKFVRLKFWIQKAVQRLVS